MSLAVPAVGLGDVLHAILLRVLVDGVRTEASKAHVGAGGKASAGNVRRRCALQSRSAAGVVRGNLLSLTSLPPLQPPWILPRARHLFPPATARSSCGHTWGVRQRVGERGALGRTWKRLRFSSRTLRKADVTRYVLLRFSLFPDVLRGLEHILALGMNTPDGLLPHLMLVLSGDGPVRSVFDATDGDGPELPPKQTIDVCVPHAGRDRGHHALDRLDSRATVAGQDPGTTSHLLSIAWEGEQRRWKRLTRERPTPSRIKRASSLMHSPTVGKSSKLQACKRRCMTN